VLRFGIRLSFARLKHMAATKPNIVFVLGGPGSGKGTQCENIVREFDYVHLSAGELLRAERAKPESTVRKLIEEHCRNGTIVPVAITLGLLEKSMKESGKQNFLIDGFPRNQDNLDGWNSVMPDKVNLKMVLFFDCPEEVCVKRCLQRGKAGSGRDDDNEESLKKRFVTFINDTMPVVSYYEKQGLVRRINATRDKDEVFKDVKKELGASS